MKFYYLCKWNGQKYPKSSLVVKAQDRQRAIHKAVAYLFKKGLIPVKDEIYSPDQIIFIESL